ncbi:MAG: PAS domain S-box protein [Actinomycetota bacterium]
MVLWGVQYLVAGAYIALALTTFARFIRHPDRAHGFLAMGIGMLGLTAVFARTNDLLGYRSQALEGLSVLSFLASGVGLMLLRDHVLAYSKRSLRLMAGIPVAIALANVFAPLPAGSGVTYQDSNLVAELSVICAWGICATEPAIRFWFASKTLPSVQKARVRCLSVGYIGIFAVLLSAVAVGPTGQGPFLSTLYVVALAFAVLLYLAFVGPRWLRTLWQRSEESALADTWEDLILAALSTRELAEGALDWAVRLVGGEGGVVFDERGHVVALSAIGGSIAQEIKPRIPQNLQRAEVIAGSPPLIGVPLQRGAGSWYLVIMAGPFTPLFGSHEIERLRRYSGWLSVAFDRVQLIEDLGRRTKELDEAQRIGNIGSWTWEVGKDHLRLSQESMRIFGISDPGDVCDYGSLLGHVHPDDRARFDLQLRDSLRDGTDFCIGHRILRADGEVRTVQTRGMIKDPNNDHDLRLTGTCEDITESRHSELLAGQLAAIVSSSEDAIISYDLDGVIVSWNHGAESLYGYTAEEAIGRYFGFLLPLEAQNSYKMMLDRVVSGQSLHVDDKRVRHDGKVLDVSVTMFPIIDSHGRVTGVSGIARDIGPRKKAETGLKRALAKERDALMELRRVDELKSDFLSTVSHEIRTPLTTIKGMSHTSCSIGTASKTIAGKTWFQGSLRKRSC